MCTELRNHMRMRGGWENIAHTNARVKAMFLRTPVSLQDKHVDRSVAPSLVRIKGGSISAYNTDNELQLTPDQQLVKVVVR